MIMPICTYTYSYARPRSDLKYKQLAGTKGRQSFIASVQSAQKKAPRIQDWPEHPDYRRPPRE